jgi:dinuclear metal center YbgI/SA1388 family protein
MTPQVKDILQILESFAPADLAEKWDNVGLLVGSPQDRVTKVLIALDPTNAIVDEAITIGANTIITHHPVIFHPLPAIHTNTPAGKLLQKALANNINIIACHTNLDSALDGVNDVLGKALGLTQLVPLQPNTEKDFNQQGLGRVGIYQSPISSDEFLSRLFTILELEVVDAAGPIPEQITKVALCGGSGSDLASLAYSSGADIYLSAEIKHSTAIWANEVGFAVIDGTHYATEKPATAYLTSKLNEIAQQKKWQTKILLTETEQHPFVSVNKISLTNSKTKLTGERP